MFVLKLVFTSFACFAGDWVHSAPHVTILEVEFPSNPFYAPLRGGFLWGILINTITCLETFKIPVPETIVEI